MKHFLLALSLAAATLNAQEAPQWLRYHSLSPDGTQIAFSYQGDIYTVAATGGQAHQLTTNAAYDGRPVWSCDGKHIAFASDREGLTDIYVMPAEGGTPTRLTTGIGQKTPLAWQDAETIIYQTVVRPSAESMQFPNTRMAQTYTVSISGKERPQLASSWTMDNIAVSADGSQWLYNDKKGYEDEWRKHHTSAITRDCWLYDVATGKHTQLTNWAGEDRYPVFAADGKSYYYVSENTSVAWPASEAVTFPQAGDANIFKASLDGKGEPQQLTHFAKHPVRFLHTAQNGLMSFSYDGQLYTMREGQEPQQVKITIVNDQTEPDVIRQLKRDGASYLAVSPSGKEVAFVVRGDVYVTSTDYNTTRRITSTPEQERNVDFAPDGRSLVYSAERNGVWQIWMTSIVDKEEKLFTHATELREECLTQTDHTSFQPKFSPDGKEVAFLQDRTALCVINLASRKIRTVMEAHYQYSYSDGDQTYCWSPDSRWLLSEYIAVGGWHNCDIVLLKADGTEMHNLTHGGYRDENPHFVLDGKAMIWQSDRAGMRAHGSWGSEYDEYIMFFDVDAYDRFLMSKEEVALLDDEKKEEDKAKDDASAKESKKGSASAKGKKGAKDSKEDEVKPLTFDLDNAYDRIVRLTVNSSNLGDAWLDKKGEVLYYTTSFEDGPDLWRHDLKEDRTEVVTKKVGRGALLTDKKQETLYMLGRNGINKYDIKDSKGKAEAKSISYEAQFDYRPAQERQYMFDHVWRQVNEKFYDPTIRGIDWAYYHEHYQQFLPSINNNYDFQDLLSEFLGELNGSHTGGRFSPAAPTLPIASLGLFYDENYQGEGLKIKEIMDKSPLTKKQNDVKPGDLIVSIDGVQIDGCGNENYLLAGKAGKKVLLGIKEASTGRTYTLALKPITSAEEQELLYHRWVERNREIVERESKGRLGYIHIKAMNGDSFHTLYDEALGRYRNCDALIVDTRHNGGGWLHDDVVTLLGAKEYTRYIPRGQYIGSDPYNKWTKPSCMLVCEDNYSNAHGTPWLYKTLGVGKLIGTPVAGTMTAVWWETMIDPTMVFGIPQVGSLDLQTGNFLENQQLDPDILIYNRPEDVLNGQDDQLMGAIREMMQYVK